MRLEDLAASHSAFLTLVAAPILTPRAVGTASSSSRWNKNTESMNQGSTRAWPAGPVYSTQPLALSGPGVTVQPLPPGFYYHFEYDGFRLLTSHSGKYYLLPVGWNPRLDITYAFNESEQVRIASW
jgi:hypothetical protein